MLMFLLARKEGCRALDFWRGRKTNVNVPFGKEGRMWGIRLLARKADVNVPFEKMGLSI